MTAPSPAPPRFEDLVSRFGMFAGAVAGTVGLIYVVGGAVMWLRFWRSDVPADQALALVPRTDLLVVGMRVLILPALAAGGLFLLMAKKLDGKPERRAAVGVAVSGGGGGVVVAPPLRAGPVGAGGAGGRGG